MRVERTGTAKRTAALAALAALTLVALAAGCGGGHSASTDTGSSDGSLYDVSIWPRPGTTWISANTKFTLSWDDDDPPPPSFTAALVRYKEDCDDGDACTEIQNTVLNRQGTDYVWEVARKDDFTLDEGGVYILRLEAGDEEIEATYLVDGYGRAAKTRAAIQAAPAVKDAGAQGAARHLVITR